MAKGVLGILRGVLPPQADVEILGEEGRDTTVAIAEMRLRVRHVVRGWPRQVRDALSAVPRPDVLVAPSMSPGARAITSAAGVGWADGTGAAEIAVGSIVVARSGESLESEARSPRWTPGVLAVAEALLIGTRATVSAVSGRTGLSARTVVQALDLLTHQGLLYAEAPRGRRSGRIVSDFDQLLDEYAVHVASRRSRFSVQVGVIWRDPVAEAVRLGDAWTSAGTVWAATSALAVAVLAPAQTQVSPLEIYVDAGSAAEMEALARQAGLLTVPGGRLRLLPFPSPGTAMQSATTGAGLVCAPWPRVYADLRTVGVRGEDVAEHLRQEMRHDRQ